MGEPYANGVAPLITWGTAAAPLAGAAFATLTAPPAGWYEISGTIVISGALETQPNNLEVFANNQAILKLPSSMAIGTPIDFKIPQFQVDGTHNVSLAPVANATASTVYTGTLILQEAAD